MVVDPFVDSVADPLADTSAGFEVSDTTSVDVTVDGVTDEVTGVTITADTGESIQVDPATTVNDVTVADTTSGENLENLDYPYQATITLFGTELSPLHRYSTYCYHMHLYDFYYYNIKPEYPTDFKSSMSATAFEMSGTAGDCKYTGS